MANYSIPTYPNIKEMIGQTFTEVLESDDSLIFRNEQVQYVFTHLQDCCENVYIEDIAGDLEDLINSPITRAEEVTGNTPPFQPGEYDEWTFYKFATFKGYVDVRWFGTSNGYYSTDVSLVKELVVNEQ